MQAKAKILVVRDVERDDIEFISKTLGCLPIAHVDHMRPEKLGHAALVQEQSVRRNMLRSRATLASPRMLRVQEQTMRRCMFRSCATFFPLMC